MERKIIDIADRDQWLGERAKDITSTQVSALYGLSPYVTEFELYHAHKNGMTLEFNETDRVKKGSRIEHYAAAEVALKLGAQVEPIDYYARIDGERFGSSFDYELTMPDGEKRLLEIKAVDHFQFKQKWLDDEAPDHIEIQLQHQFEAGDRWERGYIAAFTSIYDFHLFERERDRDMGASLRGMVKKFWKHVEAGVEPKPNFYRDADVIKALFSRTEGSDVDETENTEFDALLARFRNSKDQEGYFQKEAEAAKAEIHRYMQKKPGAYSRNYKLKCDFSKPYEGKEVTSDMVGSRIGARDSYRKCLVTPLNKGK